MSRSHLVVIFLAAAIACSHSTSVSADKPADFVKPKPTTADEPMAKELSFAKAAEYLDNVSVMWTRERKCGTCHTNYPYLMARPAASAKGETPPGLAEVRKFFEDRVANWETAKPRWDTEVVATGVTLAFNDAQTTGKLHPLTKKALDKMWSLQQKDGAWNWLKCSWPPYEHDDYFGAVFAAVGVSIAPDNYAQTDSAKDGLARLRGYFKKTPPPDIHHKAWLMWASLKLEDLMTKEEREATIKELLALQKPDGGWSLPSLGDWKGANGKPNDKDAPSDGYGTGFVVYVLRQSGISEKNEQIQRGVAWLKTNQRESGRWFTKSLNSEKTHYVANAGTGFAVLALKSCEEEK